MDPFPIDDAITRLKWQSKGGTLRKSDNSVAGNTIQNALRRTVNKCTHLGNSWKELRQHNVNHIGMVDTLSAIKG